MDRESALLVRPIPETITHEQFLHRIRDKAIARLNAADRKKILEAKLVYGAGGRRGLRGVCFHDAWRTKEESTALIEVCAFGEESKIQLAGTTLHELGHCLAGWKAGHGQPWKEACEALGLVRCRATSQEYGPKDFAPEIWDWLTQMPAPSDGRPFVGSKPMPGVLKGSAPSMPGGIPKPAPCPLGYGTQGGESRGPGSGRLRLYMCQCPERPNKARVASDKFNAQCLTCGSLFEQVKAIEGRSRKITIPSHMRVQKGNVND